MSADLTEAGLAAKAEGSSEDNGTRGAYGPSTRVIRATDCSDNFYHGLTLPEIRAATYGFRDADALTQHQAEERAKKAKRDEYGRYGNPTVRECAQALADIEGADKTLLFPSGMNAITSTFETLINPGAHLIIGADCYRQTREVAARDLKRQNIQTSAVPINNFNRLAEAIRDNTEMIFFESPTNPHLRVVDLRRLVALVEQENRSRSRPIRIVIDSTFATPINQRPLELGVDLVIHSATKYLSGYNDLLAGTVNGSCELLLPIQEAQGRRGNITDPAPAKLLHDHLSTLAIRVQRHNENGLALAEFLERHPKVERVWYPGLESHDDHVIAQEQFLTPYGRPGFGGVVSFTIRTDYEGTQRFVSSVRLAVIAPSLGSVRSLIEQPAHISYSNYTPEERAAFGIADNLVRYAAGIEDSRDLIVDLDQALDSI